MLAENFPPYCILKKGTNYKVTTATAMMRHYPTSAVA